MGQAHLLDQMLSEWVSLYTRHFIEQMGLYAIHSTIYWVNEPSPFIRQFVKWMGRVEQMIQNKYKSGKIFQAKPVTISKFFLHPDLQLLYLNMKCLELNLTAVAKASPFSTIFCNCIYEKQLHANKWPIPKFENQFFLFSFEIEKQSVWRIQRQIGYPKILKEIWDKLFSFIPTFAIK